MLDRSRPAARLDRNSLVRLDCYLGDNIRLARLHKGLSLADLEHLTGVSEAMMKDYELGQEHIGASMLYRIAVALDVTLASLFGMAPL